MGALLALLTPGGLRFLGAGLLLAALWGGGAWVLHHEYEKGYAAAETKRAADEALTLQTATSQAWADQKALSDKFLLAQRDRFKENHDAQTTIDLYRARLQSGADVLRLPAGVASCSPAAGGNTAAAGGPGGNQGSDLVPAFAGDILGIAGDVAAGVRRENALIAAYNMCRNQANKR